MTEPACSSYTVESQAIGDLTECFHIVCQVSVGRIDMRNGCFVGPVALAPQGMTIATRWREGRHHNIGEGDDTHYCVHEFLPKRSKREHSNEHRNSLL